MDLVSALDSFVRVAHLGSFSQVAIDRGLTQPAVSRQIAAVEKMYRVRLLHRNNQGIFLTEEGRDFLPAAERLIEAAEALYLIADRGQALPLGKVRVRGPDAMAGYLSAHIGKLLAQHPEISVELEHDARQRDFIRAGIDIDIRIGRIADSALVARRCGTVIAKLVGSPKYLATVSVPRHPRELRYYHCLSYSLWGDDGIWWFNGPEGDVSVEVISRLKASSAPAIRQFLLEGGGIAILPLMLVADDLSKGRLQQVMVGYEPVRLPVHLVYASRQNVPARTRVVIEFLLQVLRSDPFLQECQINNC